MEFFASESEIHGLGCFNRIPIKAGDRFKFHLLPIEKPHNLVHHAFPFNHTHSAVVLSEFSYCNHSDDPNFHQIDLNKTERTITFEALRDIPEYSEITIKYRD